MRKIPTPSASALIDVAGIASATVLFAIHDRRVLRAKKPRARRAT
jgi:hypothetical protein